MLQGALCQLRYDGTEDVLQPLVHLTHHVSGGCGQHVQKHGRCGHVLASPSKGGELLLCTLDCRDMAYLKHRFLLVQVSQSRLNDRPLINELSPSLCSFMFDVVL
jgi:hypothetical protein